MKTIFIALSKRIFYHRFSVSKFALNQNNIPLNPFMNFDYGEKSDGVKREIDIAEKFNKKIKFFPIDDFAEIKEINESEVKEE